MKNRALKFRAWDLKNDGFISGLFLIDSDGDLYTPKQFYGEFKRLYGDYHIMQFTGLHDRNGQEVWEGDVIMSESWLACPRFCEVVYYCGGFALKFWPDENLSKNYNFNPEYPNSIRGFIKSLCEPHLDHMTVIGHIYESQETLRGYEYENKTSTHGDRKKG